MIGSELLKVTQKHPSGLDHVLMDQPAIMKHKRIFMERNDCSVTSTIGIQKEAHTVNFKISVSKWSVST